MNFNRERKLRKKGYKKVVGVDEAGRGSLAGPVVAAAVMIKKPKFKCSKPFWILDFGHLDLFRISNLGFRILRKEIRDSKKLSSTKREKLYKILPMFNMSC